jgi:hypothetical protein
MSFKIHSSLFFGTLKCIVFLTLVYGFCVIPRINGDYFPKKH